jgi:hypothetical protein
VSIDPSSIPNFGGQPEPQPQGPAGPVVPDQDLVKQLLDQMEHWNRRTLWPKVYSHTHDDGTVRLIGEAQMLIGTGVDLNHFVSSTVSWVRAAIEFDKWLVEQLGIEQEVNEADKPEDDEE